MKFGIQGTVIGWQDPWAGEASDRLMRTGTGSIYPSQDPAPDRDSFMRALKELKADFYVHHLFPGLEGQQELLADAQSYDMELCLGNEYGNINGPWVEGTNRYDIPDEALRNAAAGGKLIGLLYDEPEHLQINAGQYRKDGWFPHWECSGAEDLEEARRLMTDSVERRVRHVREIVAESGLDAAKVPLLSEQVFPVLFHAQARGGMALCPKIMKESFQPLQLANALGAAKQYERAMWICADLWGPDVGPWPIRTPGFPGHSPEEFESALRMGYYMGPSHLFTENADALLQFKDGQFHKTVFGEVWDTFIKEFVPLHPLDWTHHDADPDIVIIHSDDSSYGQNERPFGLRELAVPATSRSVFQIWHLLSGGTIPGHGNNMHISGFDFPRHELKRLVPPGSFPLWEGKNLDAPANMHPLFYPAGNVLVYDQFVTDAQLGSPGLIFVAGSSVSDETLHAARRRAELYGATVIAAKWLLPPQWQEAKRFPGGGVWLPASDFLADSVKEVAAPLLGDKDCWSQRFGSSEVRIHKRDAAGFTLDFEIRKRR